MKEKRPHRKRVKLPQLSTLEGWVFNGSLWLIPLMALALGTVTTRPLPLLAARVLLWGVASLWMFHTLMKRQEWRVPWPWLLFLGAALWALVQSIPLPSSLLRFLSPEADRLFHAGLDSLGLYGSTEWRPLSLAPGETLNAAGTLFALTFAFAIGASVVAHDQRLKRVLTILAKTGFVIVLIGLAQKALLLEKVFGYFDTRQTFFFSTFISPNHLAGFLGLCIPIQIVLAVKETEANQKGFYAFLAVACTLGLVATFSTGGIASLVATLLLLAALGLRRKNVRFGRPWILGPLLMLAPVAGFLLYHLVSGFAWFDLRHPMAVEADQERAALQSDAWEMSSRFLLTGSGAESFKSAFAAYKTFPAEKSFLYPENFLVQLKLEMGFLWSLLFPASLLILFALSLKARHLRWYDIGILSALFFIALHNLSEHTFGSIAIAYAFTLLFGMMSMRMAEKNSHRLLTTIRLPTALMIAVWGVATLTLVQAERAGLEGQLPASISRVRAVLPAKSATDDRFEEVLKREIDRYPTEPYLRVLASQRYSAESPSSLPMRLFHLGKAKFFNPTDSNIDREMGESYARAGMMEEARESFRLAQAKSPPGKSLEPTWLIMLSLGMSRADLVTTLPSSLPRALELAGFLLIEENSPEIRDLLDRTRRSYPEGTEASPEFFYLLGRIALKEADYAEAREIAENLIRRHPRQPEGYELKGESFFLESGFEEALTWYAKADALRPANLSVWFRMADAHLALGKAPDAQKLEKKIHALCHKHPEYRLEAWLLSARIQEALHHDAQAMAEYERALRLNPRSGYVLARIGLCHERLKHDDQALRYYQKALALGYEGDDLLQRTDDLKKRLLPLTGKPPAPPPPDAAGKASAPSSTNPRPQRKTPP